MNIELENIVFQNDPSEVNANIFDFYDHLFLHERENNEIPRVLRSLIER